MSEPRSAPIGANVPTPPKGPGLSEPGFSSVLILGGILVALNLFVLGMAWATVNQGRWHAQEQAVVNATNLAQVLQQNLEADIRAIDLGLFAVKREIAREQAAGGISPVHLNAYIQNLFALYPTLDAIRTANAQGEIDCGIGVLPGDRASIRDRDYFQTLKLDLAAGLVISKPVLGRISHKWVIILARRIDAPNGTFGGVVYGVITLDSFTQMLAKVDPGPQGSVVLRDGDLGLVARYPYLTGISDKIGDKRLTQLFQSLWNSGKHSGTYMIQAASDGVERTFSYRQVGPHPLLLNVGLASNDYLAQWRREARKTWAFSGLFCLLSTLLGSFLLRAWYRERQHRLQQLSHALEEVKALSGLLPICSSCKKIRDDRGYWNQIEAYIQARTEAQFTHGICPECARQFFPDHFERKTTPGT